MFLLLLLLLENRHHRRATKRKREVYKDIIRCIHRRTTMLTRHLILRIDPQHHGLPDELQPQSLLHTLRQTLHRVRHRTRLRTRLRIRRIIRYTRNTRNTRIRGTNRIRTIRTTHSRTILESPPSLPRDRLLAQRRIQL